jgi:hypothetical protein
MSQQGGLRRGFANSQLVPLTAHVHTGTRYPIEQGMIVVLRRPMLFHSVEGTSVMPRTTTLRFLGKATLRTTLLPSRSNE